MNVDQCRRRRKCRSRCGAERSGCYRRRPAIPQRDKARVKPGTLVRSGVDPIALKREQRQRQTTDGKTLRDALTMYGEEFT